MGQTATAPAHTGAQPQPAVEGQPHMGGAAGRCWAPDGVAALERQLACLPGPGMPGEALLGQGLVPAAAAQAERPADCRVSYDCAGWSRNT